MVRKNSDSGDLPNDSEALLSDSSGSEDSSLASALSRSLGLEKSGRGLSASQKYSKTTGALVEVGVPIVNLKEAVVVAAASSKKRRSTGQRGESSDLIDDNANAGTAEDSASLLEDRKGVEDEREEEGGSINYFSLYRYSSGCERFVVIVGAVIAGVTGVVPAIANYSFGKFTKSMVDKGSHISQCPPPQLSNASTSSFTTPFMREIETFAIWQCSLGLFEFLAGYFFVLCLNSVAENQVHKIRKKYFEKLLSQDIGWFDVNAKRDFSSRLVEDMLKIQDAISEKVGMLIAYIFNSIFLIALSFFTGWKLSLALMAMFPVLGLATAFNSSVSSRMTEKEQEAYSEAGSVAEEVLTNIRTVHAFNGQQKEIERYDKKILYAKTVAIKKHLLCGLGNGLNWFLAYANYAYAFWYGTHLVLVSRETGDGLYGPEHILVIFFSILMAGYYIGDSAQFFQVIAEGAGAARGIFPILNRVSKIDSLSENGLIPRSRALGEIQFENVKFSYPTRPTVPVLKNLNLTIKPGQTVALVGSSGCGKSTCIALLQRFYDPSEGQVKIDGVDVKELNIRWLRGQCGVVGQEPVLFRMSIGENIGFGLENVSQEEIEQAAKMSFAHEFVSQLPLGYDTCVGERGAQLSGGQKQRIAIARALVRNPPILLLDEATSALDFHSEAIVQAALERARQGRTTLIIAHRLSTIRAADLVVAIDKGEVVECGTHSDLLALEGLYYKLVMSQEDKEDLEESPEELLAEESELVDTLVDEIPQLNPDWNSSPISRRTRTSSRVRLISETSLADPSNDNAGTVKTAEEPFSKEEGTLWRLWRMNFQEWPYLLGAVFCSTVKGLQLPVYAYVFGRYIQIFTSKDDFGIKAKGDWFALVYVFIATVVGIDGVFQYLFIGISGENFTYRIRKLLFSTLVDQDVSFYDEGDNTVGNLCSRLSTDATSLRGVTGSRLSGVIQSGTIVLAAGAMSFYLIPKMSAVTIIFVPVMIYGAFLEGRVLGSSNVIEKESIEKSCNLAVEALNNVRTVASLCAERKFLQMYDEALADAHRINKKRSHIRGMVYGLVNSGAYFCYALSVFYGGYLVENECVLIGNVFTVAEALIFCTTSGGAALAIAPDYDKGKIAAVRIFKLLERVPGISKFTSNQKLENPEGKVGMEKVSFYYKSRPSVRVLHKVDFLAQPGTNVALVGPSGSGKSTVAALILRFYDPSSGIMRFDDQNLKEVDLNNLRQQISLVSQEPNLFDYSIAENVAYGDNSREVPMNEIIEICKTANIHDFIVGLPAGYETRVGSLGVQLSGGQKQRVAIARALIRHPKLLVLDEATSALDMESEKVVQDALEVAKAGRTCITIAHRLSSIQNADQIIVMKNGRIREIGTHSDLIRREDGLYHGMWFAQRTQTQIQSTID